MNLFGPESLRTADQTDDIVGVVAVHETAHEVVLPRHFERRVSPGLGRLGKAIEVVFQRGGDHLVRIEHEHPLVGGLRNRIVARRLDKAGPLVIDDPATVTFGDRDRGIGAVHIA